ncbi:MAG TPA: bifunctional DNA-formamidopyrimidine glycosylase/DNA-(apurinic or apyrimidinic site) lyase [Nevskiaceae bacterium]|nr:bifunctional DNA-formamidopyrimidine glycosylase/DNA-(apurinic or apyrimidinic site) lyase [Nevskiaceae bacterium]
MPELPEVETIRRGLDPFVVGRRIERAVIRETRLRWPVEADLATRLEGQAVTGTGRRGKYLWLTLAGGDRLIVHLGMSGRLFVLDPATPLRKHDHLDLQLGADRLLRFNDPRRFGAVLLWPGGQDHHPLLDHLGPEPFSEAFDGEHLYRLSRGRSAAVKTFIMDGAVVVGAGNIYAAESLFRAGIRPQKPAGRLNRQQCARLAQCIREVLAEAVEQGGTTLRDFAGAHGEAGYFQQDLYVYGREGQPCRVCGSRIRGQRLGQRASCWCPRCQR